MQDYWQQQQSGPRSIDNQQVTTSYAKRHSVNNNPRGSVDLQHDKKPTHLSLMSLGPTVSNYPQPFSLRDSGGFHTLPSQPQYSRPTTTTTTATPGNYYFGCHPSQTIQNSMGEECGDIQSRHFLTGNLPPSNSTSHFSQYFEHGRPSNEELDKSEDLIYESIYDTRWRLLNQVRNTYDLYVSIKST